jgi:flagellar hook-basal body complex protein FliE
MIGLIPAVEALTSMVSGVEGVSGAATKAASVAKSGAAATDFGQMMRQVASDAMDSIKAGERVAISGVQGKASVQQVVEAVMAAERSLQTAVAVRDKITSAYQEISRMAI